MTSPGSTAIRQATGDHPRTPRDLRIGLLSHGARCQWSVTLHSVVTRAVIVPRRCAGLPTTGTARRAIAARFGGLGASRMVACRLANRVPGEVIYAAHRLLRQPEVGESALSVVVETQPRDFVTRTRSRHSHRSSFHDLSCVRTRARVHRRVRCTHPPRRCSHPKRSAAGATPAPSQQLRSSGRGRDPDDRELDLRVRLGRSESPRAQVA